MGPCWRLLPSLRVTFRWTLAQPSTDTQFA